VAMGVTVWPVLSFPIAVDYDSSPSGYVDHGDGTFGAPGPMNQWLELTSLSGVPYTNWTYKVYAQLNLVLSLDGAWNGLTYHFGDFVVDQMTQGPQSNGLGPLGLSASKDPMPGVSGTGLIFPNPVNCPMTKATAPYLLLLPSVSFPGSGPRAPHNSVPNPFGRITIGSQSQFVLTYDFCDAAILDGATITAQATDLKEASFDFENVTFDPAATITDAGTLRPSGTAAFFRLSDLQYMPKFNDAMQVNLTLDGQDVIDTQVLEIGKSNFFGLDTIILAKADSIPVQLHAQELIDSLIATPLTINLTIGGTAPLMISFHRNGAIDSLNSATITPPDCGAGISYTPTSAPGPSATFTVHGNQSPWNCLNFVSTPVPVLNHPQVYICVDENPPCTGGSESVVIGPRATAVSASQTRRVRP